MARPRRPKRRKRLKPASPDVARVGMQLPFVAIVGRPNVGKSTLFNRLIGQRLAITEPTPGTTRDRIAALLELDDGRMVELCDTGGLGGTDDAFDRDVNTQIDLAVDYADLILFLVDAREGLLPLDERIGRRLQRTGKPVVVVANKCETGKLEALSGEFYALGFPGEILCISAIEGHGRWELLEELARQLPAPPEPEDEGTEDGRSGSADERLLRVAVVGRRNTGKSTYVNQLVGDERVIASDTAGTTRDAIDVRLEVGGRELVLIDTAGLRKRGRADDQIEIISHGRARLALRRCDVALLFLDCLRDVASVDKKIASMIEEEHKACVIVANKWDLVDERMDAEQFSDYVAKTLPNLVHCPLVSVSATEGLHAQVPVELAFELYEQSLQQVGTGVLNRALAEAIRLRRPKPVRNQLGKVYFATQIATNPVTLLLFVNDPQLFQQAYRRFLVGQLRERLPWKEVPIKLVFRARQSLYKQGGGLARRVKRLGGLAGQARWVDNAPATNVQDLEATLDAADVQAALHDAFGRDEAEEGADRES